MHSDLVRRFNAILLLLLRFLALSCEVFFVRETLGPRF